MKGLIALLAVTLGFFASSNTIALADTEGASMEVRSLQYSFDDGYVDVFASIDVDNPLFSADSEWNTWVPVYYELMAGGGASCPALPDDWFYGVDENEEAIQDQNEPGSVNLNLETGFETTEPMKALCIYIEETTEEDVLAPELVGEAPITWTAPPVEEPAMTGAQAKSLALKALPKKYGRSWRKGKAKKVSCVRKKPDSFRCKATWKYKGKGRKGSVTVSQ